MTMKKISFKLFTILLIVAGCSEDPAPTASTPPVDCHGVTGGLSVIDCAGICGGSATADDCAACTSGVYDCSGTCDGTTEADCAGVCGGSATADDCAACTSGIYDCSGTCDGTSVIDCAGVCGGNETAADCETTASISGSYQFTNWIKYETSDCSGNPISTEATPLNGILTLNQNGICSQTGTNPSRCSGLGWVEKDTDNDCSYDVDPSTLTQAECEAIITANPDYNVEWRAEEVINRQGTWSLSAQADDGTTVVEFGEDFGIPPLKFENGNLIYTETSDDNCACHYGDYDDTDNSDEWECKNQVFSNGQGYDGNYAIEGPAITFTNGMDNYNGDWEQVGTSTGTLNNDGSFTVNIPIPANCTDSEGNLLPELDETNCDLGDDETEGNDWDNDRCYQIIYTHTSGSNSELVPGSYTAIEIRRYDDGLDCTGDYSDGECDGKDLGIQSDCPLDDCGDNNTTICYVSNIENPDYSAYMSYDIGRADYNACLEWRCFSGCAQMIAEPVN